jgi:hypothetical protein
LKMTPKALKIQIEGFWKQRKNDWERTEYQSWLTGLYVMNAIGCSVSRKHKYPKNPMEQQQVIRDDLDYTEEQKDLYRKQLVKRLLRMEKKFNKAKEKERQKQIEGGQVS